MAAGRIAVVLFKFIFIISNCNQVYSLEIPSEKAVKALKDGIIESPCTQITACSLRIGFVARFCDTELTFEGASDDLEPGCSFPDTSEPVQAGATLCALRGLMAERRSYREEPIKVWVVNPSRAGNNERGFQDGGGCFIASIPQRRIDGDDVEPELSVERESCNSHHNVLSFCYNYDVFRNSTFFKPL